MLNAMGGAHLAGTEMGQQQAEFMASAITAGLPISKIGSLKGANMIDPSKVRFSQSSIKGMFNDGGSIGELAGGLKNGTVKPIDVPPIRLVEKDCKLFSLDNRRLEAFRQAGVDIPYRMATPEEIAAEAWKFTTQNGGTSIRVRGQ